MFSLHFSCYVFQIEDQMIFAHRSILAISSEYFRAMFVDHFKEHHTLEVTLESVSAESAASLVDYMYTGQLNGKWHFLIVIFENLNFSTKMISRWYSIRDMFLSSINGNWKWYELMEFFSLFNALKFPSQ